MEEEKQEQEPEPKDALEIKYPWGFSVVVKQSSGRKRTYRKPDHSIFEIEKK